MVVPPESAARVPDREILEAVGAHEGHFEVGVRVDAAGHDVAAGGVEHLVALEVLADRRDDAAVDQHVGLVGQVGGDDGAALDHGGHWLLLICDAAARPLIHRPRHHLGATSTMVMRLMNGPSNS